MKNILPFFFIAMLFECGSHYREFMPVVSNNEVLLYVSYDQMPNDFSQKLKIVLDYYQESYQVDPKTNRILIPDSLYSDKELMWNYTSKANDHKWIVEHSR